MSEGEPGGQRAHILVVEDEVHLAEGIVLNLEEEGYRVSLESDGLAALERARQGGADLVVLDVMLPSLSGFEVCEALRREGVRVPILFLTARGALEDRVLGLEIGGDDYLVKPFRLQELLVRVRALLRRQGWYQSEPLSGGLFRFGESEVDFVSGRYRAAGGSGQLTDKELAVLKVLIERRGEPVSRDDIIERCWGPEELPTSRTVDNFVLKLRRRFEADPKHPRHIRTAFGRGYRFEV